jgi:hypothetical protein
MCKNWNDLVFGVVLGRVLTMEPPMKSFFLCAGALGILTSVAFADESISNTQFTTPNEKVDQRTVDNNGHIDTQKEHH